ncbi:hypothetical protein VTN00DRAFT_6490 [Thermoascus crustaceus]|uniref:uncharacterized protein n=1 Tax=Thermoascus crustaceus TaxID=5088 RepID=UPI003743E037
MTKSVAQEMANKMMLICRNTMRGASPPPPDLPSGALSDDTPSRNAMVQHPNTGHQPTNRSVRLEGCH